MFETSTTTYVENQIKDAKLRAELFSKSLQESRQKESMALKALQDERLKWVKSFEEKSLVINQLERELVSTVTALEVARNPRKSNAPDKIEKQIISDHPIQNVLNVHRTDTKKIPTDQQNFHRQHQQNKTNSFIEQNDNFTLTPIENNTIKDNFIQQLKEERNRLTNENEKLLQQINQLENEKLQLNIAHNSGEEKLKFRVNQVIESENELQLLRKKETQLLFTIEKYEIQMKENNRELINTKAELTIALSRIISLENQIEVLKNQENTSVKISVLETKILELEKRNNDLEDHYHTKLIEVIQEATKNRLQMQTVHDNELEKRSAPLFEVPPSLSNESSAFNNQSEQQTLQPTHFHPMNSRQNSLDCQDSEIKLGMTKSNQIPLQVAKFQLPNSTGTSASDGHISMDEGHNKSRDRSEAMTLKSNGSDISQSIERNRIAPSHQNSSNKSISEVSIRSIDSISRKSAMNDQSNGRSTPPVHSLEPRNKISDDFDDSSCDESEQDVDEENETQPPKNQTTSYKMKPLDKMKSKTKRSSKSQELSTTEKSSKISSPSVQIIVKKKSSSRSIGSKDETMEGSIGSNSRKNLTKKTRSVEAPSRSRTVLSTNQEQLGNIYHPRGEKSLMESSKNSPHPKMKLNSHSIRSVDKAMLLSHSRQQPRIFRSFSANDVNALDDSTSHSKKSPIQIVHPNQRVDHSTDQIKGKILQNNSDPHRESSIMHYQVTDNLHPNHSELEREGLSRDGIAFATSDFFFGNDLDHGISHHHPLLHPRSSMISPHPPSLLPSPYPYYGLRPDMMQSKNVSDASTFNGTGFSMNPYMISSHMMTPGQSSGTFDMRLNRNILDVKHSKNSKSNPRRVSHVNAGKAIVPKAMNTMDYVKARSKSVAVIHRGMNKLTESKAIRILKNYKTTAKC